MTRDSNVSSAVRTGVMALILPAVLFWQTTLAAASLTLSRENNWLIIHGVQIPGEKIRINYLEAYCRADSTDADWGKHTVIKHKNELISVSVDKTVMKMRDTLQDGLVVEHTITARDDEVDFKLVANNPTSHPSEAHWAQPCVRLG